MSNNQSMSGTQQFAEGTAVYDAGGEKIGAVSEHNVQGQYLVLHKGMFRKDIYVPVSAVQRNDTDGIYLTVYKDDLANDPRYEQPPMGGSSATTNQTRASTTGQDDVRVPLREEDLVVGKQQQQVGDVRLHKDVVTEQQTVNTPVTREEVTVERVAMQGQATDVGPDAFTEKDIDVPVMGEKVVVGKQVRETEEVRLHKQDVTEQQQVSDTVRKERVTVEGANEARGADKQGGQ